MHYFVIINAQRHDTYVRRLTIGKYIGVALVGPAKETMIAELEERIHGTIK